MHIAQRVQLALELVVSSLSRPIPCYSAMALRLVALLALLSLTACSFEPASFAEIRCEHEGEIRDGATCQNGFWVAGVDLDVEIPDAAPDTPDTDTGPDADVTCQPESDHALCTLAGAACGTVELQDRCGADRAINCGVCEGDEVCESGVCVCIPEDDQAFCDRLAADCGSVTAPDNCGEERNVTCGTCEDPYICGGDSRCTCPGETITELCEDYDFECGTATVVDGCGQTREVTCGGCDGTGEECTQNNLCVCEPLSEDELCEQESAQCGPLTVTDNCGVERNLDCGGCDGTGESCDGDNQCHCPPESTEAFCARNNAECGMHAAPNNCGDLRNINCGGCDGVGESCNVANQCVCIPTDDETYCANQGAQCGSLALTDNCGEPRYVDCGTCTGTDVCNDQNRCETCEPLSDAAICANENAECGIISDYDGDCGPVRDINCGGSNACNGQRVCAPDLTCCSPETDEALCAANPYRCDQHTVTDSCGQERSLKCYSCRLSPCEDNPNGPGQCCHYPRAGTCYNG